MGAGWFLDDVSLSQSVPARLALDTPSAQRFTANRQEQYFVVSVPAGGHLRVLLDALAALGINEVYCAEEFAADPPILEFGPLGGSQPTLLLYGRSGTNYTVLVTTNLSGAWLPDFTLPNSFRFIGTGNPTNGMMFFKATRP